MRAMTSYVSLNKHPMSSCFPTFFMLIFKPPIIEVNEHQPTWQELPLGGHRPSASFTSGLPGDAWPTKTEKKTDQHADCKWTNRLRLELPMFSAAKASFHNSKRQEITPAPKPHHGLISCLVFRQSPKAPCFLANLKNCRNNSYRFFC